MDPYFEIVTTSAGAISIRNNRVGEIMHNPVGPWKEANDLYIDQSSLRARLASSKSGKLVLFDVGLGAASNAVAAITAALESKTLTRPLHIVSFENDLNLLRFTLEHAAVFKHLEGMEAAMESVLVTNHWKSPCGRVVWDLRHGDFLKTIDVETETAELIFFDPYSPTVNQDMWTLSCFEKLRRKCAPASSEQSSDLYTYSVSTPIRVAMLLAGFFVGYGIPTGLKEETTQASTHFDNLRAPLASPWLGRWKRSHKKLPYDAHFESSPVMEHCVLSHRQFLRTLSSIELP